MTGIEGVGWPIRPRAVSRAASRSEFTMPPEPGDPGQAAAVAETPAMSPASMLSLQEVGGETVEDREARRHGNNMLAALGELQRALLAGGGDAEALQRLMDLSTSVVRAKDPRLAALVSAIVVRARVELARRQL